MELGFVKMHGSGNDFIILDFYSKEFSGQINFDEVAKKALSRYINGEHIILFSSLSKNLEPIHKAYSREALSQGAAIYFQPAVSR